MNTHNQRLRNWFTVSNIQNLNIQISDKINEHRDDIGLKFKL